MHHIFYYIPKYKLLSSIIIDNQCFVFKLFDPFLGNWRKVFDSNFLRLVFVLRNFHFICIKS